MPRQLDVNSLELKLPNGGRSQEMQKLKERKKERNTKSKKRFSQIKMTIVVAVLLMAIGGLAAMIVLFNQELGYVAGGCTPELPIAFNDIPHIVCTLYMDDLREIISLRISYDPEAFSLLYTQDTYNHTMTFENFTMGPWNVTFSANPSQTVLTIDMERGRAKCGTSGTYTIEFIGKDDRVIRKEETKISVKSEIYDVSLTMKEDTNEGGDNATLYAITCSAKSGCHPAPIELLGVVDGEVVPLYTVNFSCIIEYNAEDGWSIACTARIVNDMALQLGKIVCRPRDENVTLAEEKEVSVELCDEGNIDDRCNFRCPKGIEDNYFPNTRDCRRFHRCVNNVMFSFPCAIGTYFDETKCACNHEDVVTQCNEKGIRPMPADATIGCEEVN
ncbi:hypothetical protein ScPMuIL_018038 [Solemya velum]